MWKVKVVNLVLAVTLCIASGKVYGEEATIPGFQSAFTSRGLAYIAETCQPILEQKLRSVHIPDISHRKCHARSFIIESFTLPKLSLTTSTTKGLVISSTGIDVALSLKWQCKERFISVSGSADVKSSGISLGVSAVVKRDPQGRPALKTTGCAFNIGGLSVKFRKGIAGWILNLFRGNIEKRIKSELNSKACDKITGVINRQANMMLASLPVTAPIDKTAEINYALVDDPTFTDTYILSRNKGEFMSRAHPTEAPFSPPPLPGVSETDQMTCWSSECMANTSDDVYHKGEFMSRAHPTEAPFSPPLPDVSETDQMTYFWLSEYMANTAGYVYQKAGAFKHTLTPEKAKIPPFITYCMNTKCLKYIVPELYKTFPDVDLVLAVDVEKPPVATISPGGIAASIPGQIAVYARDNGTQHYAFTLGLMIHTDVTAGTHDNGGRIYITAEAQCIKTEVTLKKSAIGQINLGVLQGLMQAFGQIGVNYLNEYGRVGFPIPALEGITLASSTIKLGQGNVLLATDFHFRPDYLVKLHSFAAQE